jgi:hypothetical protein
MSAGMAGKVRDGQEPLAMKARGSMGAFVSTDTHLRAWMTAPEERRAAAHAVLTGCAQADTAEEPTHALNELPPFFGFKHYTTLSRLQVQRVGISFGGRLRYRISDVRRWLQSDECNAIREERRRARREREERAP